MEVHGKIRVTIGLGGFMDMALKSTSGQKY